MWMDIGSNQKQKSNLAWWVSALFATVPTEDHSSKMVTVAGKTHSRIMMHVFGGERVYWRGCFLRN